LIREIDALGGLIAKMADLSAIQFKVLNLSKGAAVQLTYTYERQNINLIYWFFRGPRAQIDRDLYKRNIQDHLFNKTPNLEIKSERFNQCFFHNI